jgi:UDPglucose 6-dehydrogenase
LHITVIGTGYVGLVTGACFADFGVNVTCVDKDPAKIEALKRGEIPIYEPGLKDIVGNNIKAGRLVFTTDVEASIKHSLVVFIAVGTPPRDDGSTDMRYIDEVARTIAANLDGYKVIVTKSTVPVGTGKRIEDIIEKENKGGHSFDVASNPEFLREGSAVGDFMRPNRVVLGVRNEQVAAILKDLYAPLYLIETPFVVTDVETAELIKYAANAFLATKISFINEMANLCEKTGGNVQTVAKAMGLDQRIGSKFLHAGPGYGGSCFPKDTRALVNMAKELGYDFKIVGAVVDVNREQRNIMVAKIKGVVGELKGLVIGVLGLTFKPNTDDVRESPSIDIINALCSGGAVVRVYDPVGMENAKDSLPDSGVTFCDDAYEVATGADCLVIATEWNQFRNLDFERLKKALKTARLVDLKNIYNPQKMRDLGFEYVSVGR